MLLNAYWSFCAFQKKNRTKFLVFFVCVWVYCWYVSKVFKLIIDLIACYDVRKLLLSLVWWVGTALTRWTKKIKSVSIDSVLYLLQKLKKKIFLFAMETIAFHLVNTLVQPWSIMYIHSYKMSRIKKRAEKNEKMWEL